MIEDISMDVSAGLKRVVPPAARSDQQWAANRHVVEYYIKRYPEGTGEDEVESWYDSHDEHVVYYQEFPV